jgi:hypothetical protein
VTATKNPIPTQLSGRPLSGTNLLVPPDAPGTPPEVLEAQALAVESMARYAEAGAALRAAKQEAEAAPRLDRRRDEAALASGKSAPRERLTVAAAEALKAAEDLHAAQGDLLATRQVQLGQAFSEAHAAWTASLGETIGTAERDALELVERLGAAVGALEAARAVAETLESWPDVRQLVQVRFFKEDQDLMRRRREQTEVDLDRSDQQGWSASRQIDRNTVALLTALRREIGGRVPPVR